jgi:hypothetical protein
MSSRVGSIIISVFPQEKKAGPEELGGQQVSSTTDSSISFEQGKPRCMYYLLIAISSLALLFYPCDDCTLHIGLLYDVVCCMQYPSLISLYLDVFMLSTRCAIFSIASHW